MSKGECACRSVVVGRSNVGSGGERSEQGSCDE